MTCRVKTGQRFLQLFSNYKARRTLIGREDSYLRHINIHSFSLVPGSGQTKVNQKSGGNFLVSISNVVTFIWIHSETWTIAGVILFAMPISWSQIGALDNERKGDPSLSCFDMEGD